jgi:hypothetical protein
MSGAIGRVRVTSRRTGFMPTGFLARRKRAVSGRRSEAQIELEAIDEKRMHTILQQQPSEARHGPDGQESLDGHVRHRDDGLSDRF